MIFYFYWQLLVFLAITIVEFSDIVSTSSGRNLNADDLIHRGSFGEETDKKASAFHESDSTSAHDEFSGIHDWSHDESASGGPNRWGGLCNSGRRQSPIDFRASEVEFSSHLEGIQFVNYDQKGVVEVQNNGHTVQVAGFDKWRARQRPFITGGGLDGRYELVQFHLHWASSGGDGSEHTVNGAYYPAELHLVHVKEGLTLGDAKLQPEGLAVIGVFLTINNEVTTTSISQFERSIEQVRRKDTTDIAYNYTLLPNLPKNSENFYRYEGSLTTPGCDESVIWTVYAEPIGITKKQLELLGQLESAGGGKRGSRQWITKNSRPVQPLYSRQLLYRVSPQTKAKFCSAVVGAATQQQQRTGENGAAMTTKPLNAAAVGIILSFAAFYFDRWHSIM